MPVAIDAVVTKQDVLNAILGKVDQSSYEITTSFDSVKIYAGKN